MAKIGLVVEGGGMKCAYSAGVLDRFLDDGVTFDYAIGVSAGSANLASFLGGQRDRNRRFYTEHLKAPEYFGIDAYKKTGEVFNLEYIYGVLSNSDGRDPLNYEAIMENPTEFEAVVTDAMTGKAVYVSKEEMTKDNYNMIKASSALPVLCKPRYVRGKACFDGGVSDAIPVQRALDKGCDKLVVIMSKPRGYVKKRERFRMTYTHRCHDFPGVVKALNRRHIMYESCKEHAYTLEKRGRAFIFAPSNPPAMSTYTMDPAIEEELYELGISDYDSLKDDLSAFRL
ncbi:MAG: patatin family protein [Eubacterium sp.]|nr:patatin family protein [Eubacterium sp.]